MKKTLDAISWEGLREANAVVCVLCVVLTMISGPTWFGVLDGFIAGATGIAVFYTTMIIRMRDHFRDLMRTMHDMAELNSQLIAGKVQVIVEEIVQDKGHDNAARLH